MKHTGAGDKLAIIDNRMSEACKNALYERNIETICLKADSKYDAAIASHPDLFVFPYDGGIIVKESVVPLLDKQMFETGNSKLSITKDHPTDAINYPKDCGLNFALCGNLLIGNQKVIDPVLSQISKSMGFIPLHVNQGYAKCNICVVADHALITEDVGIAVACRGAGIDVLCLETHSVCLDGYQHGFIGGASSSVIMDNFGNEQILFCGNIQTHPEYVKIFNFCQKYQVEPVSLSEEPLCDAGSIIILGGKGVL